MVSVSSRRGLSFSSLLPCAVISHSFNTLLQLLRAFLIPTATASSPLIDTMKLANIVPFMKPLELALHRPYPG